MTTIAWDGTVLAADKQSTDGGLARTVTKIFKDEGGLYGLSGSFCNALEVMAWVQVGANPKTFPKQDKDEIGFVTHITPDGKIWRYEGNPTPSLIEDKFFACGSGRDFAMAAMHCGKKAINAVEIAGRYDTGTGRGIDYFELNPA